jgi:hypothetical protein
MAAALHPQLAMDERAITNPELEAALERRLRAKDDVSEVQLVYKRADEEVKAELARIPDFPPDSALRIGRFRVSKRHVAARSVSFETEARDQLSIGLVDEDGAPARTPKPAAARGQATDDDVDVRPKGQPNLAALRGDADRATRSN